MPRTAGTSPHPITMRLNTTHDRADARAVVTTGAAADADDAHQLHKVVRGYMAPLAQMLQRRPPHTVRTPLLGTTR